MKIITLATLAASIFFSTFISAADYAVELEWNTNNLEQVLDNMPEQKAEFSKLIDRGDIKDMYVKGKPGPWQNYNVGLVNHDGIFTKDILRQFEQQDRQEENNITLLKGWMKFIKERNLDGIIVDPKKQK